MEYTNEQLEQMVFSDNWKERKIAARAGFGHNILVNDINSLVRYEVLNFIVEKTNDAEGLKQIMTFIYDNELDYELNGVVIDGEFYCVYDMAEEKLKRLESGNCENTLEIKLKGAYEKSENLNNSKGKFAFEEKEKGKFYE